MLNNKIILVTGGTGSFGRAFVDAVYKKFQKVKKLIIFSRDELKQSEMREIYNDKKYHSLRFFLGDVRDAQRLIRAAKDVDILIHAAALKQVPAAEYNPMEFIKTNILGAANVIEAAITCKIKKVIALSSDKAASPINLYGATKLCSDKLFIAANNYAGSHEISFSVIRYGNVMNSRGSVVPAFMKMKEKNQLMITDKNMTRFNISLQEGVNFVLKCLKLSQGGEIFVPKLPSFKILDLAKAVAPKAKIKFIGVRQGEKIDEELITKSEAVNSLEFRDFYIIFPNKNSQIKKRYEKEFKGKKLIDNFSYNSKENHYLNVNQLKKLILKN